MRLAAALASFAVAASAIAQMPEGESHWLYPDRCESERGAVLASMPKSRLFEEDR